MEEYCRFYSKPAAMNMVEENGKLWMALLNRNGICEVDKEMRKAKVVARFEKQSISDTPLYCHVEKAGDNLVFSPGKANEIAIYNLKSDSISYIPLRKVAFKGKESPYEVKFWNTFCYKSDLYLLGYSYPAIIRIDMNSMEVQYITDWIEEVEKNICIGDNGGYLSDGHVIIGDIVLLPVPCMKALLELNLKNAHTRFIRLELSMKGIGGISSADGENIWLVGRKSKTNWISCWNRRTNSIKEFCLEDMSENLFDPFYAPICTSSKVFLMPISAPYIYELDINKGKIEKNSELTKRLGNKEISSLWGEMKTLSPRLQGNCLVFLTGEDLKWHKYNIDTEECEDYYTYLEEDAMGMEDYFNAVYGKTIQKNIIISETKIPLNFFAKRAVRDKKGHIDIKNMDLSFGETIYSVIQL